MSEISTDKKMTNSTCSSTYTKTFVHITNGMLVVEKKRFHTTWSRGYKKFEKQRTSEIIEHTEYPLIESTKEEIKAARFSGEPILIIKRGSKLYLVKMPGNVNVTSSIPSSKHLCSNCKRCRALPISEGGCLKIQDMDYDSIKYRFSPEEAYLRSKRLEKYNFVLMGIESFNFKVLQGDFIVILDCALKNRK